MALTICHCCILAGVAPVRCATFISDMKLPAMPMVVPTKAAIIRMAIMPTVPETPAEVRIRAATMIMKMVMPETGSLPV